MKIQILSLSIVKVIHCKDKMNCKYLVKLSKPPLIVQKPYVSLLECISYIQDH